MTQNIDSLKRRPQGEKKNPEYVKVASTKDGQIELGHLHLGDKNGYSSDVTAGVYLQAYDSRHYMSMDIDGPRTGWTLNRCPGPYEILCASDDAGVVGGGSATGGVWPGVGFFLLAENGDIVIRAPKGRIRMSALDIDIKAEGPNNTRGSINIDSNQSVNIKTGTFDVLANVGVKIFTPKSMDLIANTSLNFTSNFMNGLTCASDFKSNKQNSSSKGTYLTKSDFLK